MARATPTINQAAQLLKQARRAVNLIDYDEASSERFKKRVGVGEARQIDGPLQIEIDRPG
jgi:hypothetical protein